MKRTEKLKAPESKNNKISEREPIFYQSPILRSIKYVESRSVSPVEATDANKQGGPK